jgi:putative DNA primase/helicase
LSLSSHTCTQKAIANANVTPAALHNTTIPWALTAQAQWLIAGADKKPHNAKEPLSADTGPVNAMNPQHWSSFHVAQAEATARGPEWRPGLCLTRETKLTLIDLDKSVSASGTLTPEAAAIVARFSDAAYIEKSCSGKGIHILVRGTLPKPPARRHLGNIECYDAGRFVVFTGDTLSSTPLVKDFTQELALWHAEYFPPKSIPLERFTTPPPPAIADDKELLARCLRSERFRALHERGDVGAYGGDDSSADLAFVNLVRLNGGTASQADALYRRSAIARPKWGEKRGERTYRELTLAKGFDEMIATSPLKSQLATLASDAEPTLVAEANGATNWEARALAAEGQLARSEEQRVRAEEQLAECSAAKDAIAARLRESERQRVLLSQVQSRATGILKNTALRGARPTVIALTNRLANWEASGIAGDARGYHALRIAGPDGLAEASGASPETVSKHLGLLEKEGLISREVRTIPEATNADTGEIIPMHRLTYVASRYASTLAMIDAAAKLTPARADKGHGGFRPACPLHPDAGTVKKWSTHCAACDVLLEAGTDALALKSQLARLASNAELKSQVARLGTEEIEPLKSQVARLASEELAPKSQLERLASDAEPTLTSHVLGERTGGVVNVLIPRKVATYHNGEPGNAAQRPVTRPVGSHVWLGP